MAVSIIQNYGSNNNPSNAPFSGPLAALYNNRYAYQALQYPRDLGSSYKGHIVKFDIYETKPITLREDVELSVDGLKQIAKNTSEVISKAAEDLTKTKLVIQPRNEKISKSISLYMPDSVNFGYETPYTDLKLSDAAQSVFLVGGIARAITSVVGEQAGPLMKLGLNAAGYVFNPQQQLMFNGINFRDYNMSFVFTPSSAQEAQNVKDIIKTFRQYAAPTVVTGLAGFFFNPPGMFDVSFLYNGQENKNLNRIKKSVITNIDVNYAPNGWAAHEDGAPVQTTLNIRFQEMELVDSKDIQQGY
jgi:hypothetical protein